MSAVSIALSLVGALALFLYALDSLSDALKAIGPERMEPVLARFSRTPLLGLLTGVAVTALLDSSSAVIIMLIALVGSRALSFPNALGIVLGANIGTTIGSQIIALDIEWLGPILLAIGVFGRLMWREGRLGYALGVLRSLGLLFLALPLIGPIASLLYRLVPDREPLTAVPAERMAAGPMGG